MENQQSMLFPDNQSQKQRIRRLQFILLTTAVILAAGITWVSLASYRNYEQETRIQLEQQLSSIATLKSSELAVWYRERRGDADMLKNSPALPTLINDLINNSSDQNSQAKLKLYFNTLTETYGYESYLVTDASGLTLLAFPEAAELEPVYEHTEDIAEAFKTGQVVFRDFHIHAEEAAKKIYLSLIVPIFDEDLKRQPLGTIIMTINPEDYLYPLITNWPVPHNTAETLLVRPENDRVHYLSPLRFNPDAALILTASLEETDVLAVKAVTGYSGIVEGIDYRGQEVIGALQEIPGTPWFMVARIDKEELFAPIQARKERAIFTTSALLLIACSILFIIWRGQQLRYLQDVGKINQELERRVLERTAQLEAANHELEAFAYSVSHDLRTPLRAMGGFSEVLQTEYGPKLDDQGKHYLGRIQAAANRMGVLIDDLLTLSRITRVDFQYEQVDLSKMAAEIIADLQAAEPERLVAVEITTAMKVRGDKHLLHLAMENLLSNAWKFSSGNTQARIEVGIASDEKSKTFYVADNGVGFDMVYSDKLYTPFQRLHGTAEFSGTGIGLSIVSRIIKRHGGEIWAQGKVGKGSTFYFTLPE
jgi:signal transduction histidine kinase